eukprot:8932737-Pyramimonas_sp.AAC.1
MASCFVACEARARWSDSAEKTEDAMAKAMYERNHACFTTKVLLDSAAERGLAGPPPQRGRS